MQTLVEKLASLIKNPGFEAFQHELAKESYDALVAGYTASDDEIRLAHRLVKATNGKTHAGARVISNVIHGPRSMVKFYYPDPKKQAQREMGDILIVGLVTSGNKRLIQKSCIIQNKKDTGKTRGWTIDRKQLFLLKNFPPVTGVSSIVPKGITLSFSNYSGCLGTYGLFLAPGDMIYMSASLIEEMLRGAKSLPLKNIIYHEDPDFSRFQPAQIPTHFNIEGFRFSEHGDDWGLMGRLRTDYNNPSEFHIGPNGQPILGTVRYARDIYDFIRAWTQLSIGDISCANGNIIDGPLDALTNRVIREANLPIEFDLPPDNIFESQGGESGIGVMVYHVSLD